MKSIRKRILDIRAREREGALPKDSRSRGKMYREVEAERKPIGLYSMVSNELYSIT